MNYQVEVLLFDRKAAFSEWFNDLDPTIAARVDRSIRRLEAGNFGAVKALRNGLCELRLNFGPGYRVYFGIAGERLVILLGGGDKRRQSADIAAAEARWRRFKLREVKP